MAFREHRLQFLIGRLTDSSPESAYLRVIYAHNGGHVMNRTFPFSLPPELPDPQSTLKSIECALYEDPEDRGPNSDSYGQVLKVGHRLFATLSEQREVGETIAAALRAADGQGCGILVLLQFDDNASDIAAHLWEALKPPDNRFLIRRGDSAVARLVAGPKWFGIEPQKQLRMLVVGSWFSDTPDRKGLLAQDPELEGYIRAEWLALQNALQDFTRQGLIAMAEPLFNPTPLELEQAFRAGVDVVHYIGHGNRDRRGEYLVLRDPDTGNKGRRMYWPEDLSEIFDPVYMARLRLMVLHACRMEALARVASKLVGLGSAAVIAMKAHVGADVITGRDGFTAGFYQAIAAGRPIHSAYATALCNIYWRSQVEAFVPTLVLGSPQDLFLLDPTDAKVQQVRLETEQRRRNAASLAQRIQNAIIRQDYSEIERSAKLAATLSSEPQVFESLDDAWRQMQAELDRLRQEESWLDMRPMCAALKVIAQITGRPEPFPRCEEMRERTRVALEQLERDIAEAFEAQDFDSASEKAAYYLKVDETNVRVSKWLETAYVAKQIIFDEDLTSSPDPTRPLKDLERRQDWQGLLTLARGMQQYPESRIYVEKALQREAATLGRVGNWEGALKNCLELLRLSPESSSAWQLYGGMLLGQAGDAERNNEWETALKITEEILRHKDNLSRFEEDALRLQRRAADTLAVKRRIQWL